MIKIKKEKFEKNRVLKLMGVTLIMFSIVLAFALATLSKDYIEDNTMNTIKVEMLEQHNIKSNEINYIRKFNSRFYEIILDNGDVYTFAINEKGKPTIKIIEEHNNRIDINDN